MSDPVPGKKLDRRALLLGAVFLVGGAAAVTRFASSRRTVADRSSLGGDQLALLERIVDIIIPDTDTPGAVAAGVPEFLRDLLAEWASDQTRTQFQGVLEAIDKSAWARFGAGFLELSTERRLEALRRFDDEAIGRADPAYLNFKQLVLVGYYQSEIGATQELRFELVPGAWRSCLPLTEVGRASAV